MILKELDPFHGHGHGAALEARISADRMAYYLRRYFRRSDELDVLNDLCIQAGPGSARIDHLLLHAHGLVVVQRESVAGRIRISDDGEWALRTGEGAVALGSPITHAYVQALLLKSYLDKRVRQKGFFDQLEFDVLVVLSDECDVEWPVTGRLAEVCVREQVYDRVIWRKEQCRAQSSRPGLLTPPERRTLGEFLRRSHLPG